MQGQYNIATHTILPLVYRILGPANHISYLLREPATQSLFLFNPIANIKANKQYSDETEKRYYSWLMEHILNIEKSSASKLTHIFCNHGMLRTQYSKLMEKLSTEDRFKNTKCVLPDSSNNNKFNTIKPEVIGELSVCFIGAEGYFDDYNLIGVTHISPTSTKIPVLFVNDLLGVSRIDFEYEQAYKLKGDRSSSLMRTLDKVKYFPNETYIFPSHIAKKTDLLFAKAIFEQQSSSSKSLTLLLQKIKLFDANLEKSPDCLIPTTLLQEKIMNPFLFPERYYQMLGLKNKDKQKCFSLLRGMRKEWSKSSSMQK